MRRLRRKQVGRAVCTILQQLAMSVPVNVVYSCGISKMYAIQIVKTVIDENFAMAALVMQVSDFLFQITVYIALDEEADYYRVYGENDGTLQEYRHDIAFEKLGGVLDTMIETGDMTKEEYQDKVKESVCSL